MKTTDTTVSKGGYFNVSTKPAEPRINTIAWGTAIPTPKKSQRTRSSRATPASLR